MSVWSEVADGLSQEFAGLSAGGTARLAVRLLVAGVLGGVLGLNREWAGKSAGLRTYALVAVGSAGFVAAPDLTGASAADVSRVVQGVAAGIGFLGAGCIVKRDAEDHVRGLTTAAGIWLTAAVGTSSGIGREGVAILIAAVGWFTLTVVGRIEGWAKRR